MKTLSEAEITTIVRKFFDHYADKKNDFEALVHDDVVQIMPEADLEHPAGYAIRGKKAFLEVISSDFEAAPNFRMDIKRILVTGQTATIDCIQEGDDMSAFVQALTRSAKPPAGPIPAKIRSVFIFDFQDGKIVRMAAYYDLFNFLIVQLGMTAEQALVLRHFAKRFA